MTPDDEIAQSWLATVGRTVRLALAADGSVDTTTVSLVRFAAPQGEVWAAITDREQIYRWFAPVSGELREGERFEVVDQASGTVLECDSPNRYLLAWGEDSQVEVVIEADGAGSSLRLTQASVVSAEFDAEYGPAAGGVGWDVALFSLAAHLNGTDVDADAWAGTDQATVFIDAAAKAWGAATVAAGADPDQALAAARRTAAFYS